MKPQFTSNYQSVFLLTIRNSWNVEFIKGDFFTGGKKATQTLHYLAHSKWSFSFLLNSKGQ